MNRAWPALATATYIGSAWLPLEGCTQFDDHGLFATPPEGAPDADVGTSGAGGASGTSSASAMTATSTSGAVGGNGGDGGSAGDGGDGGSGGAGGTGTGGRATGTGASGAGGRGSAAGGAAGSSGQDGGVGAGGRGGAGGGSVGDGSAGSHSGGGAGGAGGSLPDAGVPKICAELHTAANAAHETAQACTQAGSFTECRLVQDECGCGVGVRVAATQATQRYLMAVQTLKDNGCFDACPDARCPPYSGVTCTPGTQSRLQCIAY